MRDREIQEADRNNREIRRTACEEELATEIRQTNDLIDRTVAEIGDLAFDLGLIGVNLWQETGIG